MDNLVEKFVEIFRKTFTYFNPNVQNPSFKQPFSSFLTTFSTTNSPLSLTNIFHYSTNPTTKTTKYIKIIEERNLI